MSSSGSDGLSRRFVLGAVAVLPAFPGLSGFRPAQAQPAMPLGSWNDGPAKQAILDFIRVTTDPSSKDFVPPEERIATFDQDGTLWVEHPIYTQLVYCLDRVPAAVKEKPALANVEPFKTVLAGDFENIGKLSLNDFEAIAIATLTGMSTDDFAAEAKAWLATARDHRWKRPYTELTYQPMQEVLSLLPRQWLQDLSSSPAADRISCASIPRSSTASRRSRWSAPRAASSTATTRLASRS